MPESPGPGFGHFCNHDDRIFPYRFRQRIVDTSDAAQMEDLRSVMRKLAFVLERYKDDDLPAHAPSHLNALARENPKIPAGYTYLMQLLSHDLVFSVTSLSLTGDGRSALTNGRSSQLRLQTIYGDGPIATPMIYRRRAASDRAADPAVFALRLGTMRDPETREPACPMRDIARVNIGSHPDFPSTALPDALIADERNDDHVIISQLTTLFHLLHNGILELLARGDTTAHAQDDEEAAFDRYVVARTACTLMYRRVLRNDLLPRLLHPTVYAAYAQGRAAYLGPGVGRVPLELTHGALRAGHSMVRDIYLPNRRFGSIGINELLHLSSARTPQEMPLTIEWAVQWSQFFEINENKPLASMRIGPRYSQMLRDRNIFRSQDRTGKDGLAYRDLLSSCLSGLWSVPALIARLREVLGPLAALFDSSPLYDDDARAAALTAWLERYNSSTAENRLSDADIRDIAHEPPLPFFLMYEALYHSQSQGLHLGPLGSVIVADSLFGIFAQDPIVPGEFTVSIQEALAPLAPIYMGRDALADLPAVNSMSDLVRLVARLHRLEAAPAGSDASRNPPFL
jgi:hypothetical protein